MKSSRAIGIIILTLLLVSMALTSLALPNLIPQKVPSSATNKQVFSSLLIQPGFVRDILIGAIGSLVAVFVQIIAKKFVSYLRLRAISSFWVIKSQAVTIIHPIHHDKIGQPISEDLARMEIVVAINELAGFFNRYNIRYSIQSDSKNIPDNTDIVLLSSPKGNRQSKYMYDRLTLPFLLVQNNDSFFFRNKSTSIDYESPVDRAAEKVDIGLVARISDKTSNRNIFLLWGVHLVGTVSTARFVTSPDKLRTINKLSKDKDIALLVQAPYNTGLDIGAPTLIAEFQ